MKYYKNYIKNTSFLYCSIRIPHLENENKTIYHLAEHLFYFGLKIPILKIEKGFQNTFFIYSATAFTDKSSINICFLSSKKYIHIIRKLFYILNKKEFEIDTNIIAEEKEKILEEIINRKEYSYFHWRDEILSHALQHTPLGFNEIGREDELKKISIQDINKYLHNEKLYFDFYYRIGNTEKYFFQKGNIKPWTEKQSITLVQSTKERKLSIIATIPINNKYDYIYSLIFSDLFFNINDSIIATVLEKEFKISDAHLETELYDFCAVFHFTTKFKKNIEKEILLNRIKESFRAEIKINPIDIKKRLRRIQLQNEFVAYKRLYTSYLRLFKLMNPHFLLCNRDFQIINTEKIISSIKKNIKRIEKTIFLE